MALFLKPAFFTTVRFFHFLFTLAMIFSQIVFCQPNPAWFNTDHLSGLPSKVRICKDKPICQLDCALKECQGMTYVCTNTVKQCLVLCHESSCVNVKVYSAAKTTKMYCTGKQACKNSNLNCGKIRSVFSKATEFSGEFEKCDVNCHGKQACEDSMVRCYGSFRSCAVNAVGEQSFAGNSNFDCRLQKSGETCSLACGSQQACEGNALFQCAGSYRECKCFGFPCPKMILRPRTSQPTKLITKSPTVVPTSASPTTQSPTSKAPTTTKIPTVTPTSIPTNVPSGFPTKDPSVMPTSQPITTTVSTNKPSKPPSINPTVQSTSTSSQVVSSSTKHKFLLLLKSSSSPEKTSDRKSEQEQISVTMLFIIIVLTVIFLVILISICVIKQRYDVKLYSLDSIKKERSEVPEIVTDESVNIQPGSITQDENAQVNNVSSS